MNAAALTQFQSRLNSERKRIEGVSIANLFKADAQRFESFSIQTEKLLFDFSKNRIDQQALAELFALAKEAGVEEQRDAMFAGTRINSTENRAVLHTALRNMSDTPVIVDGKNVMGDVKDVLKRMNEFSERVREGDYSVSGGKITDVVNIGIGGSDLGPRMVVQALSSYVDGPKLHFVANVDGADISDTLETLNPQTTLFIIASKTFTTQETMTNAQTAAAWMKAAVGDKFSDHFCALSTNLEATREFGISDERTFGFWDWVGGRYSVWSAIGLSVMIAVGEEQFDAFLQGAHTMDRHFAETDMSKNIPVVMALLGVWYRNIWDMPAVATLAYDNRLARFAAWLQQLDMESNGKSITKSGDSVNWQTGPIIFGEAGTNGQHAFYQLIHQGTTVIPCDFLVAAKPNGGKLSGPDHHRLLVANCFAQSEALMKGRALKEAGGDPHKVFSGNRPSNTLLYEQLDPFMLGYLMALYEHKIFVQGVIWGINSFDQWGVELGKELAKTIDPLLQSGNADEAKNGSTRGLIEAFSKVQ